MDQEDNINQNLVDGNNDEANAGNEGMDVVQDLEPYEPGAEIADLVLVERELAPDNEGNEENEGWDESESSYEHHDQSSNEEEEEDQQPELYEIARSSRHEYLGDTEEVSGRTLMDDGDCLNIPILILTSAYNLVLLPSQTLPLTIFCALQQSMLRNAIAKDKIIGIIHTGIDSHGYTKFDDYGTTAEIYEYHSEEGSPSLSVKAKGRQRFKVISTHRETTGLMTARVRILPEIRMPDPLRHVRLRSQLKRSSIQGYNKVGQKLEFKEVGSVRCASSWKARREASMLTAWPTWVYDQYDDEQLSVRLVNEIVIQFNMMEEKLQIPRDPQELSHWAAINLPITDTQRQFLLSLNTATQRLRYIICIISQTSKGLFCNYCDRLIANTSNILCMSSDGLQGTFVNPDGYIHEMITVTKATNIRFQGQACTRHSWFPGYSWKITNCNTCHSHIGWLFVAEKCLKPRSFYGISRSSVKTKMTGKAGPLPLVF